MSSIFRSALASWLNILENWSLGDTHDRRDFRRRFDVLVPMLSFIRFTSDLLCLTDFLVRFLPDFRAATLAPSLSFNLLMRECKCTEFFFPLVDFLDLRLLGESAMGFLVEVDF